MRVIAGSARGRRLRSPPNQNIRPTSDRVKEAVFNMLGPTGQPGKALDLFAGSGALGIEAISRGSNQAVFVDVAPKAIALIQSNLQLCRFSQQAKWFCSDVVAFLRQPAFTQFNLVLMDPPYRKGLVLPCLKLLQDQNWLSHKARVFAETEAELSLPMDVASLGQTRCKRYGETRVFEYRYRAHSAQLGEVDKHAPVG